MNKFVIRQCNIILEPYLANYKCFISQANELKMSLFSSSVHGTKQVSAILLGTTRLFVG